MATEVHRWISWKGLAVAVVTAAAWFAGQSGWVTLGPADRIQRLEAMQASTALQVELHERQISGVQASLTFAIELLCQPQLDSTARSSGDRYLQSRCRAAIGGRE